MNYSAIILPLGVLPVLLVMSGCPHGERRELPVPRYQVQEAHRYSEGVDRGHASVTVPSAPGVPESPTEVTREKALSELKALGGKITQDLTTELVSIDLANTRFGDEGVEILNQIPNLQQLDLSKTEISDQGLARLASMPRLEFLNLAHTSISDRGLERLPELPGLKYIVLNGTKVTDTSFAELAKRPALEGVSLMETAVTEAGVKAFQVQRPNCTVLFRHAETSATKPSGSSGQESPSALLYRWKSAGSGNPPAAKLHSASWQPLASGPIVPVPEPAPNLELDLEDASFLKTVSEVYLHREEWDKAAVVLRKALKQDPDNAQLRHRLGVALGRSGHVDQSFLELREAGGEAAAHYNLGIILYENALKESGEHFQQAMLLDPGLVEAQTWLRFLQNNAQSPWDAPFQPEIMPTGGVETTKE